MKIAIMQPYLFPYIGYFQLIKAVDKFIIDDSVQWIKRGWINRNRILLNGQDKIITLYVKKRSNYDKINQFEISDHEDNRQTYLNRINAAYFKAPYYKKTYKLIKDILMTNELNLSRLIFLSLKKISIHLGIKVPLLVLSKLNIDKDINLKSQERVIYLSKKLKASIYINSIGGLEIYNRDKFKKNNLKIFFIKPKSINYNQKVDNFISNLSIIDVMMFNPTSKIKEFINKYDLV